MENRTNFPLENDEPQIGPVAVQILCVHHQCDSIGNLYPLEIFATNTTIDNTTLNFV